MKGTVLERLEAKIERITETGCWVFTGCSNSTGYGFLSKDGSARLAHRVSYEEHVGPIPEGKELDHLCRVRCCVNPKHLEAVIHSVNSQRGETGSHNKPKSHCIHGHELSGSNVYVKPNGRRACRACISNRSKKYQAKLKENNFAKIL